MVKFQFLNIFFYFVHVVEIKLVYPN